MMYELKAKLLPELGHLAYNQITHHRLDLYIRKRLRSPIKKNTGRDGLKKVPVKNPDGSLKTVSKTTIHRELSDIMAIHPALVKQLEKWKEEDRDNAHSLKRWNPFRKLKFNLSIRVTCDI